LKKAISQLQHLRASNKLKESCRHYCGISFSSQSAIEIIYYS